MALFPRYGRGSRLDLSGSVPMPGTGGVLDAALAAERRRLAAGRPAPNLDLSYGLPEVKPMPASNPYVGPVPLGPAAAPVKTGGMSDRTRSMLGAALQGASAGIRADVGPARPGGGFAQGILKGIVGAGAVQADRERAAAAGAAADASLINKIKLLQMGKETPAEAANKAGAVAAARLPYDLQKLAAVNIAKEQFDISMKQRATGMTDAQLEQMNKDAIKLGDERLAGAGVWDPSQAERDAARRTAKQELLSKYTLPPAPVKKIPQLPG